MWRSLIWKQWHEQAWRVAFATTLLCAVVAIGVRSRIVSDDMLMGLTLLGSAFVLPIFMAMGLIAPDRADRTHLALMSLPVHPAITFAVTTIVGLAATLIPLICAAIVYFALAGEREATFSSILWVSGMGLYVAFILLWWTLCLAAEMRSEGMVGLVGIAIVVFWTLWINIAEMDYRSDWSRLLLWPAHPLSPQMLDNNRFYPHLPGGYPLVMVTQLLILAALWLWGLRAYRRTEARS